MKKVLIVGETLKQAMDYATGELDVTKPIRVLTADDMVGVVQTEYGFYHCVSKDAPTSDMRGFRLDVIYLLSPFDDEYISSLIGMNFWKQEPKVFIANKGEGEV